MSSIYLFVTVLILFSYVSAVPNEDSTFLINGDQLNVLKKQKTSDKNKLISTYWAETNSSTVAKVIGKKCHIKNFPYTVSVMTRTSHEGSAVILNKKWVLTSGWVVLFESPSRVLVRAGSDSAIDKGQTSWASKLITHPNYAQSWEYDLALIKLKSPLKFNKNVKSIRLANSPPKRGSKAVLSGFGYASNSSSYGTFKKSKYSHIHDGWLRASWLEVLPYNDCREFYQLYATFTNTSFCTVAKISSGPCFYDYGSPLVVNKKLSGIFSGVPACAAEMYPPVYTVIVKLKDWIKETIKNNSHPLEIKGFERDSLYY